MSTEEELLQLARNREAASEAGLAEVLIDRPDLLLRQMRTYLGRVADYGKISRAEERILQLVAIEGGLNEFICPKLVFSSGAWLEFKIRLQRGPRGWLLKQFRFHLRLPRQRDIKMVRIHMNPDVWHDPLTVPRCHLHIGDSQAHIPFPVMNPWLILHLICEHLEADFGTA